MKEKRIIALFAAITIIFSGLSVRLTRLSVPSSALLQAAATHGSYNLTVSTTRGTIYDTNHKPLVNNRSVYYAVVSPSDNTPQVLAGLSPYVADVSVLEKKLAAGLPFAIEVSSPQTTAPGVRIVTATGRYTDGMAPHIIGYIDGSGNGVTGLEQAFNSELKKYSQTLTASFPVDASGHELTGLSETISQSGDGSAGGVVTTLDADIQQAAQRAADKYMKDAGCIVVMEPKTGDVLASVSSPDYSQNHVADALKGANNPLINRAFSSYNLGSVFKIVMVAAALETGIPPSFSYTCSGAITVKGRAQAFRCPEAGGHGTEDMSEGFANSCNTYFINLGQKLGGNAVLSMARTLGFGTATSFASGFSTDSGNLPTDTDVQMPAELANLSIGEGKLLVTPVQVARLVSTVVNGGLEPTPRLVKELVDNNLKTTKSYPAAVTDRVYGESTAEQQRQFMVRTVEEGTGTSAKPVYGGAGGKTGTAQTGVMQNGKTIDQAWFAGFYPAQSPKYVIVALVENGTSGGANAGPVFKYLADFLAPRCGFPAVPQ